jgi:hypothetical protein
MVREIAVRWNQIEPSILTIYEKLVKLSYADSEGMAKILKERENV